MAIKYIRESDITKLPQTLAALEKNAGKAISATALKNQKRNDTLKSRIVNFFKNKKAR
ncbi:hypothetical protein OYT88_00240 [Sporolactobacillus sp. CQH2019]|uniref:hypothetical protein n=1 Tax=Sporolactobacillus sp. CQH2019 TaxID=3023512 RepID=UPI002367D33E|nr:hypothetical protein [Sporolactobacillus sp. CQH2019]MDD9146973.1 hypothetical protein [Sporolactobacillus sp. CQH2019]